ncbi:MAG: hypothetical protein ABIE22_04060 [archaeon]
MIKRTDLYLIRSPLIEANTFDRLRQVAKTERADRPYNPPSHSNSPPYFRQPDTGDEFLGIGLLIDATA